MCDDERFASGAQMTVVQVAEYERLVKSDERVRDLGEVFTPAGTTAACFGLYGRVWTLVGMLRTQVGHASYCHIAPQP